MKKHLISFIAMVLGTIAVNAQNTINISDFTIRKGETKEIAVELNNSTEYTALQMDITLGKGLTFATIVTETGEIEKDITLNGERIRSSHTIAYNELTDNAVRVISYSSSNAGFRGTNGAIVYFKVTTLDDESVSGDTEIRVSNIFFTAPNGVEDEFGDITAKAEILTTASASVTCGYGGTAMLSAEQVEIGSPLTLFIAPYDGYKVSQLLLNDTPVGIKNNIYKVEEMTNDAAFNVTFEEIVPDTVEVIKVQTDTLIQIDTLEIVKVVTDTLIQVDTLEIVKVVTDTIEIETIETDTIFIAEITEIPAPEISFNDGMMSITCALQGARIFYTLDGSIENGKEYTAPVEIKEDCTVIAYAMLASEQSTFDITGTGIGGITDEVISRKYYTEAGVEIEAPREGVNIVIITYESGKTETKKVVVRKK
ncbi:MAG: hypothetical protein E7092_01870 [Bacteroidales bacterium]|nr:hypothetical protein [Bacteroidales bacterium]